MNLFDLCVYKNLNKGSGGDVDVSSLVATENKTYNAGEGKAYNPVVVNVPTPPPSLQSLTASHNGYFVPSSGYDGFDEVTVEVATPLETLSATENGTYTPSSGYEGFSEVTVDVPLPNNAYLLESQKNDVVTIQHGAEFDMPKLIASIEPQQSGSGDPSPTNIRPISGWTACNVARTGKNLVDITSLTPTYAYNGITYTINSDGSVVANGTATARSQVYWSIPQDVAKTFANKKLSGLKAHEGCSLFLELNETPYTNYGIDTGEGATIDSSIENTTTTVNLVIRIASGTTVSNYVVIPRITDELNTYTINFVDGSSPLTVYGGTLDVLSGLLTINHEIKKVNTLNWYYLQNTFYSSSVGIGAVGSSDINSDFVCSFAKSVNKEWNQLSNNECTLRKNLYSQGYYSLCVKNTEYTDATDFKNSLDSTSEITFPLATPQTYQLTPTEVIKSLLGVNNIFADTGKVDVQIWTKEVTS